MLTQLREEWPGARALFQRNAVIQSRSVWLTILRFGIGIALFLLVIAARQQVRRGAPGLHLLSGLVLVNIAALWLLAAGTFTRLFAEERHRGHLPFLRASNVGPWSLIIGNGASTVQQCLILILMQTPFIVLCLPLGGVTLETIWASLSILIAAAIVLSAWALFCSAISRSPGLATVVFVATTFVSLLVARTVLFNSSTMHLEVLDLLRKGGAQHMLYVPIAILLAAPMILMSHPLLGEDFEQESDKETPRKMAGGIASRLVPARAHHRWPVTWKDLRFTIAPSVAFFVVLLPILVALISRHATTVGLAASLGAYVILLIGLPRSIQRELRFGTLSSLAILPEGMRRIWAQKLFALGIALFPCLLLIYLLAVQHEDFMLTLLVYLADRYAPYRYTVGSFDVLLSPLRVWGLLGTAYLYFLLRMYFCLSERGATFKAIAALYALTIPAESIFFDLLYDQTRLELGLLATAPLAAIWLLFRYPRRLAHAAVHHARET